MSYFDVFGSIFEKSAMTDLPKVIVSICLVSYNICMIPHVWRLTFGLNLSGAWGVCDCEIFARVRLKLYQILACLITDHRHAAPVTWWQCTAPPKLCSSSRAPEASSDARCAVVMICDQRACTLSHELKNLVLTKSGSSEWGVMMHLSIRSGLRFGALNMKKNKLALLWGEAQKKIAYSYLKVT